jgi:outer membrane protein assembly factor BamB/ribosomal protein L7/L12
MEHRDMPKDRGGIMLNTPTSLNCPACGAPLDIDGTRALVRCKFCGSTLLVPGALPAQAAAPESTLDEIRRLVESGNRIEAIKRYRQVYDVNLQEASDAIDALQAGRLATPSAEDSRSPEELTRALQEVQRLLADGDKVEAIRVYREVYDVSQTRATYAVEQIEAGRTTWPEAGFRGAEVPPSGDLRQAEEVGTGWSGKWIAIIITLAIVIFVAGIAFFVLLQPGSPLSSHYYPSDPIAMIPSEPSEGPGTAPEFAALLYNPDKDSRFFGLIDGTTGKLRWQTADVSSDAYASQIVAAAGLVYIANDTDLLAHRIDDGSLVWQAQMPDKLNYGDSTMLVTAGRVITNNADQTLQAYDAETGQLVWSKRLAGYDRTLRLMGDSLVVIDYTDSDNNYGLVFVDPSTGRQQRVITPTCTHEDYSFDALGTDSGLVYDQVGHVLYLVSDASYACIMRIDLASGQPAWQVTGDSSYSFASDGFQSLMTETTLYFGNGNDLLAVDKSAGTMKALLTDPDHEFLPLAMAGDNLIVRARRTRGTERFELWGVNAATGERAWQLDMQAAEPIDPPDAMSGLVDDTDSGWTWKLVPAGLVVMKFQGKPNQLVLETFNPADGTSLGQQTIALKMISGDFYGIPSVIGWRENIFYFGLESNIYGLDLSTGKLKVIY